MTFLSRIKAAARRRLFAPAGTVAPDANTIDLDDAAIAANPFPHYDRLRASGSVQHLAKHGSWIVLGYDDARHVLGDAVSFSNAPYAGVDAVLLGADPPRQAIVRRVLARRFAAQRLAQLDITAQAAARALIEHEMDAVSGYAVPISRAVAADLIGFDQSAVAVIVEGIRRSLETGAPLATLIATLDEIAPRAAVFEEFAAQAGEILGDAEVRSLVGLLWLAATTTTERVIAQAVLRLATDHALAARLRGEPALLAPFIEEVLRLHPPEHLLPRATTAPAVVGGVEIPAGALVQVCVAAANRDPSRFEHPHELRLDRREKRHLAFGSGVHHCLGAPLGRHVVAASLTTLLAAAPGLRLRVNAADLPFFRTASALSPLELPIAL